MTKIISWNVNGLRAVHRKGHWDDILSLNPDILCLQETKATADQLPDEVREPKGYQSHFHSPVHKKGYSGVGIYTKEEPALVSHEIEFGAPDKFDEEGRLIMAQYKDFTLINCYFPNGGGAPERLRYKLDFYDNFLEYIDKLHKKHPNIIFCGDVNVAHKEIDLARPKENETHIGFLPIERAWMDKLLKHGWVDVYRHFNPDKVEAYTYWDMKTFARERNVGWRIDYFFVSKEMLKKVESIEILSHIYGSDHCPIQIVLKD